MTVVSVRATRQRVAARARRRELSVVTSRAKIRPGSSRSQQVLPDLDALSVAQQAVEHGNADSINNGRVAHAAKSGANRHGPLSPRRGSKEHVPRGDPTRITYMQVFATSQTPVTLELEPRPAARSLVVVSNRLPFVAERGPDGIVFTRSSGGLVAALDPVLSTRGGV